MQGAGRLTILAVVVCLLLVAGYAWVGYSLQQQFQAETALLESLNKTAPVYLALRRQPADDVESLTRQVTEWQQKVAAQQALFPKESEVIAALDTFLALAKKNQIFITNLDVQSPSQQKTQAGVYQVARYSVKAKGSWLRLSVFLRRLAELPAFVPMGFDNLAVSTDPLGDDLSFDLLIYVRTG
jgi:Tfp pilus assembly protein PilO